MNYNIRSLRLRDFETNSLLSAPLKNNKFGIFNRHNTFVLICYLLTCVENCPHPSQPLRGSQNLTLMSSLRIFSHRRMIFLPPSTGASVSLMSMITSSFFALASNTGTEETGSSTTVYLPGRPGSSRNA